MPTPRKTYDQMLNDSYLRGKSEPIQAYEYDDSHIAVFNENSNGEYLVEIDNDTQTIINCTCPHRIYRLYNYNIPCKHMCMVGDYLGYDY